MHIRFSSKSDFLMPTRRLLANLSLPSSLIWLSYLELQHRFFFQSRCSYCNLITFSYYTFAQRISQRTNSANDFPTLLSTKLYTGRVSLAQSPMSGSNSRLKRVCRGSRDVNGKWVSHVRETLCLSTNSNQKIKQSQSLASNINATSSYRQWALPLSLCTEIPRIVLKMK